MGSVAAGVVADGVKHAVTDVEHLPDVGGDLDDHHLVVDGRRAAAGASSRVERDPTVRRRGRPGGPNTGRAPGARGQPVGVADLQRRPQASATASTTTATNSTASSWNSRANRADTMNLVDMVQPEAEIGLLQGVQACQSSPPSSSYGCHCPTTPSATSSAPPAASPSTGLSPKRGNSSTPTEPPSIPTRPHHYPDYRQDQNDQLIIGESLAAGRSRHGS